MKNKFKLRAALLSGILLLTGCSENKMQGNSSVNGTGYPNTEPVTEMTVPSADFPDDGRIFLVSEYTNYAWGYQDHGVFLDTLGDIYNFELGGYTESDISFNDILEIFRKYTSPTGHIDENTVRELYNSGSSVNPNAPVTESLLCYDYGQSSLYFFDSEKSKKVQCYTYGDYERISTDLNANLFREKWEKAVRSNTKQDNESIMLLPRNNVAFRDYPSDGLKLEGNYILFNKKQLPLLAEKCGIPVDSMLDDLNEYFVDDSVFFVSLAKSSAPVSGFMRKGDSYDFVSLSEGEEQCCHIAVYQKRNGDFSLSEYMNFAGEKWQMIDEFDPNSDQRVRSGNCVGISDSAISRIYVDYSINKLWGLIIDNENDYNSFVSYCNDIALMEDGSSVRDRLEVIEPDFDNYVLCIKIQRRDEGQTYLQKRIEIGSNMIDIGDSIVPKHETYTGMIDGVLAWLWLPADYIERGNNYSVK